MCYQYSRYKCRHVQERLHFSYLLFTIREWEWSTAEWVHSQFNTLRTFTLEDLRNNAEIDENRVATVYSTDEEILKSVTKDEEDQMEDDEKEELLSHNFEPPPSVQQAFDAGKSLEKYLLFRENDLLGVWTKRLEKFRKTIGRANEYNRSWDTDY